METEKSRGISLRKKRTVKPKISAPKQISAPISQTTTIPPSLPAVSDARGRQPFPENPSLTSLASSRSRGPTPTNTADYVKRRYSTRINALPRDLSDAPSMPSMPVEFLSQPPTRNAARAGDTFSGERVAVDLKALQDPRLSAEQYVAHLLANASEQEIREYQADLSKIKNRTSVDLQNNVYQNRSQFLKISQEAERLKGEMRALRSLMSELTGTLGQTNAALGINTEAVSARKYANRSSVANLEAMWSTHLQELWRRVEGSQKYLPAIPGRHVLHESGRWVELNTATFKPRRRVHLILLNDHLLVAIEKKRAALDAQDPRTTTAQAVTLVAERCLPLQDIEVSDLGTNAKAAAASAGRRVSRQPTSNAINIRVGPESFTYAAMDQDGSEKPALLSKVRKAVADLRKVLHVDVDDAAAQSSTSAAARQGHKSLQPNGGAAANETPTATMRASMLVEVDGRQQSFRWVETLVDELDIDIALQRFEEAVGRIENLRRIAKSNRNNSVVRDLVDGKVADRAARLAKAITRQLVETNSMAIKTREYTRMLTRLGFEAVASSAFLDARTKVVRTRLSQVTDTGDLPHYLFQVSYITFTLVRNTVAIYQACFTPAMASAAIKWAKEHVDDFNRVLARQLGHNASPLERDAVLDRAREHADLLKDVGIDFRSLVGREAEI